MLNRASGHEAHRLRGRRVRGRVVPRQESDVCHEGTLFEPGAPIVVARAPGRLDVMGGIADYSGSLVLQWPIREATLAAVQAVIASRA